MWTKPLCVACNFAECKEQLKEIGISLSVSTGSHGILDRPSHISIKTIGLHSLLTVNVKVFDKTHFALVDLDDKHIVIALEQEKGPTRKALILRRAGNRWIIRRLPDRALSQLRRAHDVQIAVQTMFEGLA